MSLLDLPDEIILQIIAHGDGLHFLLITCRRFRRFMTPMSAYDLYSLKKWYKMTFLWHRYGTLKMTFRKTPRSFSDRFDEAYLSVCLAQKLYPMNTLSMPMPNIVKKWGEPLLHKIEHFIFFLGHNSGIMWKTLLDQKKIDSYHDLKHYIGEWCNAGYSFKIDSCYKTLTMHHKFYKTHTSIVSCCANPYYWHALVISGVIPRNKLTYS